MVVRFLKQAASDFLMVVAGVAEWIATTWLPYDLLVPPPDEIVRQVPPVPKANGSTSPQFGLRLPNGSIVWDNALYRGHPLATPEQRAVLVEVLRRTAADLSFNEQEFLGHYGWVQRARTLPVTEPKGDIGDSPIPVFAGNINDTNGDESPLPP